jgi:3-hydroxymyristoyl/3-hydroxydecanoyl-(acyl carrier protein) dehydratase
METGYADTGSARRETMNAPFICYNRKSLETILSHRGAALNKIDGVLHVSGGHDTITGLKVVRDDDPDMEGHFPGVPTYPGYVQDEFVCLVAAALIPITCVGLPNDPHVVQKIVRYKKSVAPGDAQNTRDLIERSFRCQMEGRGFSMIEILSTCPTNWNMTPAQSTVWLREKMMDVFRLGIFKDATQAKRTAR